VRAEGGGEGGREAEGGSCLVKEGERPTFSVLGSHLRPIPLYPHIPSVKDAAAEMAGRQRGRSHESNRALASKEGGKD